MFEKIYKMLATFLFLFVTVYLAQMGDKTQLLTIILSTHTTKRYLLFLAVMTGFAISVTLAVLLGEGLSNLVPHKQLELISGSIFILIGVFLFINGSKKEKKHKKVPSRFNFWSVAILIFLTDFGDKTQISVALFSTNYMPVLVWLGAMSALAFDTILVIYFSKAIIKRFNERTVKRIAGVVFATIGGYLLISHMYGV